MPPKRKDMVSQKGQKAKKRRLGQRSTARKNRLNYFPFMKLPAEIRNKIYRGLLEDPEEVHLLSNGSLVDPYVKHVSASYYTTATSTLRCNLVTVTEKYTLQLDILLASKEVYNEASGFLWTQTFVLASPMAVWSWLSALTPATVARLERITIRHPEYKLESMVVHAAALRRASNLRCLRLECPVVNGDGHFVSDARIAWRLGSELWCALGPLIASIVDRHGLRAVTKIIKFREEDLNGPDGYQLDHPWTRRRKNNVLAAIRNRLATLMDRDNARRY